MDIAISRHCLQVAIIARRGTKTLFPTSKYCHQRKSLGKGSGRGAYRSTPGYHLALAAVAMINPCRVCASTVASNDPQSHSNAMKKSGKYEFDFLESERLRAVLSERVASSLPPHGVRGFLVTDDASDTAASAAKYGIDLNDCANTIVVRYRKDAAVHHAAVVVLGSKRIDVNGSLKAALAAQRISFADREDVIATTGMEYGGITAFGLPDSWSVVVDVSVMERAEIVMGGGVRAAKFVLEPNVLLAIPHVRVASISV